MPGTFVYIDIHQEYPFDACHLPNEPSVSLRARKIVPFTAQPRLIIREKINLLKRIGSELLVGLKSSSEDDQRVLLVFEYIPSSYRRFEGSVSNDRTETMRTQLSILAEKLTQNSIQHSIRLENIGMDENKNLKYYLGTDFKINKVVDRNLLFERYSREIDEILLEKINNAFEKEIRKTTHREISYYSLRTSESVSKKNDEPKRVLRKSQMEGENRVDSLMTKKPQKGLQLKLSPELKRTKTQKSQYQSIQSAEIKQVKIEELGARINKLRLCMKQIIGKTPPKNCNRTHLKIQVDGSNPNNNKGFHEDKSYITPNYTKYEKKIAQFRESRLVKAQKEKEILYAQPNQGSQVNEAQKIEQKTNMIKDVSKTLREPHPKNRQMFCDGRLSFQVAKTTKPLEIKQPSSPNSQTRKNPNCFSSGFEDERKIKDYIAMAEKDKYCQEFMNFLEEQNTEPSLENNNSSLSQSRSRSNGPEGKDLKIRIKGPDNISRHKFSQHISTECSERGIAELQNKIKSVINNSLKIITHLKARESIPVE